MQPLGLADRRHVDAVKGWCELHAFKEANRELEEVAAEFRAHLDVLEVRWQVRANQERWEEALDVASALMRKTADRPEGYIYVASSLQESGRMEEALAVLLQGLQRFPSDEIVLYDLACLSCLLSQPRDARGWLERAIAIGGDEIKKRALDDPDLGAVWSPGDPSDDEQRGA